MQRSGLGQMPSFEVIAGQQVIDRAFGNPEFAGGPRLVVPGALKGFGERLAFNFVKRTPL